MELATDNGAPTVHNRRRHLSSFETSPLIRILEEIFCKRDLVISLEIDPVARERLSLGRRVLWEWHGWQMRAYFDPRLKRHYIRIMHQPWQRGCPIFYRDTVRRETSDQKATARFQGAIFAEKKATSPTVNFREKTGAIPRISSPRLGDVLARSSTLMRLERGCAFTLENLLALSCIVTTISRLRLEGWNDIFGLLSIQRGINKFVNLYIWMFWNLQQNLHGYFYKVNCKSFTLIF